MLQPKRTKYRKQQRGRMKGIASRGNTIAFGDFALQALEPCWITSRQIEAGRRAMTRYARRGGKLWIRVFPDKVVTARAADTRMGSGKGAPDYWVAVVKPGTILYEMKGVNPVIARTAMRNASYKMPIKTAFITRPLDAESRQALLDANQQSFLDIKPAPLEESESLDTDGLNSSENSTTDSNSTDSNSTDSNSTDSN